VKRENVKSSRYVRGSEWRRWDLHVHTPLSKLGSSFPGVPWSDYVAALETAAVKDDIAVIGVTDYLTIDGYERLYTAKSDGRILQRVALLIPNIELRAQPATKDGKALNIHLLVNPSDPDHIARIKRALKSLKVEYTGANGKHSYGCTREELIEFAREQRKDLSDDDLAYKFGIEQFKPSYSAVFDWIDAEGWLRANTLIGIANGKDGISGLPVDGFSAHRDEILKRSHFVFSGNPADREYYLGRKPSAPVADIVRMYGSLKPCFHGSDAHDVDRLFRTDEDRFCWLKADPTFEGLRQTLWEPSDRVHIGSSSPRAFDSTKIMSELRMRSAKGWFSQGSLPLNHGLVVIIGEKGAGKTAVADLIAFASGVPYDERSQSSFITKGRPYLRGLEAEICWGNGSVTGGTLVSHPYQCHRALVRYLSQDFVERLCSNDHEGSELQSAIEDVVFSHLDEVHREDYSSFEELRSARESASQSRQADLAGQIATANREIERLIASLGQREAKVAAIEQSSVQLDELRKQIPEASRQADETVLKALEEEKRKLKEVESSISSKSRQKRNLDEFLKTYSELKERTQRAVAEMVESAQLSRLIGASSVSALYPTWTEASEVEVRKKSHDLGDEIAQLRGSDASADRLTLAGISKRVAQLEQSLIKDEVNRRRLFELQRQVDSQEKAVVRMRKEVSELDGKTQKLLEQKKKDRLAAYVKYFEALAEDEKGLRELYDPMRQRLADLGSEMKFELSTGFRVAARDWLDRATKFYDGRKPAALAKKDAVEAFVHDVLSVAWDSGNVDSIEKAIEDLAELISPVEFMGRHASPTLKMVDLLDWLRKLPLSADTP